MELEGKIVKILAVQTGTSARGEWRKQEFIVESSSGQYPKQACLYLWGDKIDEFELTEGDDIRASIEIESREYNDRWYTNVRAWRIEKKTAEVKASEVDTFADGPAPASPFSEPKLVDLGDEDDGLPF